MGSRRSLGLGLMDEAAPIRNERNHSGQRSYPIPVWNGILDHRARIGPALWVFLWCLDRITEEELGVGFVLGGTVVAVDRIACELQDSDRTVRRHLQRLAKHGYIGLKRAPYGFIITVANSRKFNIWRSDKNGHSDRTRPPVRSDKSAGQTDKIVRCIKEDTAVDSTQRQILPPTPQRGLTPRQLHNLSKEMDHFYEARVGSNVSEEEALRTACVRRCLPLDLARVALARSCGEKTG
jgi:hypothetical protein